MLTNQRPAVTSDPGLTHRHQSDGIRNATTATTTETCGLLLLRCGGRNYETIRGNIFNHTDCTFTVRIYVIVIVILLFVTLLHVTQKSNYLCAYY